MDRSPRQRWWQRLGVPLVASTATLLLVRAVPALDSRPARLVLVLAMTALAVAFNWSCYRKRSAGGARLSETIGAFAFAVMAVGGWIMFVGQDVIGALGALVVFAAGAIGWLAVVQEWREHREPPEGR
jgi:hypothetical protein